MLSYTKTSQVVRFPDVRHSINKIKEKNELELALTNPSVGIDRMDYCLAMYHKKI